MDVLRLGTGQLTACLRRHERHERDAWQETWSCCRATVLHSAGSCHLQSLPVHALTHRSVAEWTLSGDRSANRAATDDTQPRVAVQSAAAALSQETRLPQVPMSHGPDSQVMTIDDGQPSAAVAHAPRTASLLQRLLSACACGSRQGTLIAALPSFSSPRLHTLVCHACFFVSQMLFLKRQSKQPCKLRSSHRKPPSLLK